MPNKRPYVIDPAPGPRDRRELKKARAKDVGVEVHSLSKGFNMIGWRIGWVCGNPLLVRAFADVKDNCDSGQFIAIQKSAAAALDEQSIPESTREKYRRRLSKMVAMLSRCGFQCSMPGGTYFLYSPAPRGVQGGPEFANAEEAAQFLITQQYIITVPWDDAGRYVRFSATFAAKEPADETRILDEIKTRLSSVKFSF